MRRLTLAAFLDRWESRVRRVGERVGWPQAWLQEFNAHRNDPRMTLEEFWVRYTLLRMETEPRFAAVKTEADARAFYAESEYMLWRNLVHRRHSAWRRVLWTMKGRYGEFLEFGCGTAPISKWVRRERPQWQYWLNDIPGSPHLAFAHWHVKSDPWGANAQMTDALDAMTLIDVLEHLSDPLTIAWRAVRWLRPGGYLHWNFVETDGTGLNRATPDQRFATMHYLTLTPALTTVWEQDGYHVSRKC